MKNKLLLVLAGVVLLAGCLDWGVAGDCPGLEYGTDEELELRMKWLETPFSKDTEVQFRKNLNVTGGGAVRCVYRRFYDNCERKVSCHVEGFSRGKTTELRCRLNDNLIFEDNLECWEE